ncbi:MAG: hypothetical protein ACOCR1_04105, partial [Planctomycetota bacterium]
MTDGRAKRCLRSLSLPALGTFLVSMGLIGLELALMRCLSVATWHHFSFLVISTALLGLGTSGTILTLVGDRLRRHFEVWMVLLCVLFMASVPLAFRLSQLLPLDFQYALYSVRQAGVAIVFHLLLFVPFLLGALVIGAVLMRVESGVQLIYGANLGGSGAGGIAILMLMGFLPETGLLYAVSGLGAVAAVCWAWCGYRDEQGIITGRRFVVVMLALALLGCTFGILESEDPLELRIDGYKNLAQAKRLEKQGRAERILTRSGPRGRLDVYESPTFHDTLFAGVTAKKAPPDQAKLLVDGEQAGTIYRVDDPDEAPILDETIMSLAYRIAKPERVLLLGESGGTGVWLARRWGASDITAVQKNPEIMRLLRGQLSEISGNVFNLPEVRPVVRSPRLFLESADRRYDHIQFVHAEGMATGGGGMRGAHEDYLLTVEGLRCGFEKLAPGGVMSITRGVQTPPRDNVKLLFMVLRALKGAGVEEPGRHVTVIHNYGAVSTLVSSNPFSADRCERLGRAVEALNLDVDWPPCDHLEPSNSVSELPGPEDDHLSWYHAAAESAFSGGEDAFTEGWIYDVSPATDNRPYFFNFFRWGAIPVLRRTFGKGWFHKAEMGYLVVLASVVEITLIGAIFILLPLLWLRRARGAATGGGRLPVAVYFLLLGVTFMLVEMGLIIRFSHLLGDPVLSAGGVVSAFLVFSGLGSSVSRSVFDRPEIAINVAVGGIVVFGVGYELLLSGLVEVAADWPVYLRFLVVVMMVAPLAFLMGWPFPNGLIRVKRGNPHLVPWAWSANGFASVAGAPLATLIAMESGLSTVTLVGVLLYVCAAGVAWGLPA